MKVPVYNWAGFFSGHFRKVPKIKSYHHFTFCSSSPGVVVMKEYSDTKSSTWCLLADTHWSPSTSELPPVIPPTGLSLQRQWYLHKEIREFCRQGTEDLVCPLPASPLQEEPVLNEQAPALETDGSTVPPAKRAKKCGLCGMHIHGKHAKGGTTNQQCPLPRTLPPTTIYSLSPSPLYSSPSPTPSIPDTVLSICPSACWSVCPPWVF